MASLIITTDPSPYVGLQRLDVLLDGRPYRLDIRANGRMRAYFLDVYSGAGALLVSGVRLVDGMDLLRRWRYDTRMPAGILHCQDSTGEQRDPEPGQLGADVLLWYETAT